MKQEITKIENVKIIPVSRMEEIPHGMQPATLVNSSWFSDFVGEGDDRKFYDFAKIGYLAKMRQKPNQQGFAYTEANVGNSPHYAAVKEIPPLTQIWLDTEVYTTRQGKKDIEILAIYYIPKK